MRLIQQILNFYINSSIHVSLAVVSLSAVSCLEYDLNYDNDLLLSLFYASICGYNFVKYYGLVKFYHRSLTSWLKLIQIFTFFCFLAMLFFGSRLNIAVIWIGLLMGIMTFFYAVPLIPKSIFLDKHKNLRQISGLKIYIIAFVWSVVTVIIPVLNYEYPINNDVIMSTIQRFFIVIVLMLPFEIRDLNYDTLRLATIPQKIGIKRTKAVGILLLLIVFLLEFFKDNLSLRYLWSILIFTSLTACFLLFAKKEQTKYYSAFWVEGLPLVWLVILLILA